MKLPHTALPLTALPLTAVPLTGVLLAALLVAGFASSATHATPARLTVADPFGNVRDAEERGAWEEVRRALGERDGVSPPLVSAPGLYGHALFQSGEQERACSLYAGDAREHAERAEAATLRFARCVQSQGHRKEAVAAWLEVLAGPVLGRDLLITDEAVSALDALGMAGSAADTALFLGVDKRPAPSKDTLRREALARTLLALVPHARGPTQPALLKRLYLELGDTPAGAAALKLDDARDLAAHKDRSLAVARAEALTARHDNAAVFATLKSHAPSATALDDEACLIRVLLGKASRKLRRYSTARANLDVAATKCGGEAQRRARYLAAQVAYYQGAQDALPLLTSFAKDFPDTNLTDDALFWKAELLERRGQRDEAEATYKDVGDRFEDGDMREDARFNHAFSRALRGDPDGARAILDEIARTAKSSRVIERDRALYWRARLSLYPDPKKLEPTADGARRASGTAELIEFATARPASWYGHLARLLVLRDATPAQRGQLDAARASPRTKLDDSRSVPIPDALKSSASFSLAVQLAGAGYDAEAELLLDGVDAHALDDDGRVVLTLLYSQVGGLAKSHQVMRFTGHALPAGKPTEASLLTWHLAFPRAHAEALTAGANAVKNVPPTLLMALAREESAFDAAVVSWAGAIGLCQLMPPTAREEAGIVKVKLGSLDALRAPALNARLGANHLSRRMSLGHPLLAIAAYNAGPGNVAKWRKTDAPRPIDAWVESIPVEQTRNYVKKVTGSWVVYETLDGDPKSVTFPFELP